MKRINELFKNPFFYIFLIIAIIISSLTTASVINEQKSIVKDKANNDTIAKCYVHLKYSYTVFPKGVPPKTIYVEDENNNKIPSDALAESVVTRVYNLISSPISANVSVVITDKNNKLIAKRENYFEYIPANGSAETECKWSTLTDFSPLLDKKDDIVKQGIKIKIIKFTARKLQEW